MRSTILLLLMLLCTLPGHARFQIFTQSNHGELDWHTMESEHFYIHYPAPLEDLAVEAASVAEQIYGPVTQQLQHEPGRRTHLAISDSDQYVNGAAIPDGSIRIFVRQNMAAEHFNMQHEWLRTVIAHEFQHVVAFSAMKDWSGTAGMLMLAEIPAWWMEGLAEYYTERWNTLRSERALRHAVLADKLTSMDAHNSGYPMVLYLTWRDGDSTLVKICSWRDKFTRLYSFPKAFKEVTGQTPAEFKREWARVVKARYYADLALREEVSDVGQRFNLPLHRVTWLQQLPDSSAWLVTGLREKTDVELALYRVAADSTRKVQRLAKGPLHRRFSLSPDGERIAFARRHRNRHAAIEYDLHELNLNTGREHRVTRGARAYDPAYGTDGSLYYITEKQGLHLMRCGEECDTLYSASRHEELFAPTISPDGRQMALATHGVRGERGILLLSLENGDTRLINPSSLESDRYPVWVDDSTLVYTSTRDGVSNLFSYSLQDESELRISDASEDLMAVCAPASLGEYFVALALDSAGTSRPLLVNEARVCERKELDFGPRYEQWRTRMPEIACPPVDPGRSVELSPAYSYRWWRVRVQSYLAFPYPGGAAGTILFADALALNDVVLAGAYSSTNEDASGAFVMVVNRMTNWDISLSSSYRSDLQLRIYDDQLLAELSSSAVLAFSRRLDVSDYPHLQGRLTVGGGIWDAEVADLEDLLADLGDNYPQPGDFRTGLVGADLVLRHSPRVRADGVWSPGGGSGVQLSATFARPGIYGEADYDWQALDLYHLQETPLKFLQLFGRLRGENLVAREIEAQHQLAFSGDPSLGTQFYRPLSPFAPAGRTEFRGLDRLIGGDQYGLATGEVRLDVGELGLFEVLGLGVQRAALAWFWDAGQMRTKGGVSTAAATCGLEAQCELGAGGMGVLAFAIGYGGETWNFMEPFLEEDAIDTNQWYWRLHLSRPF